MPKIKVTVFQALKTYVSLYVMCAFHLQKFRVHVFAQGRKVQKDKGLCTEWGGEEDVQGTLIVNCLQTGIVVLTQKCSHMHGFKCTGD
jgi:hypothetical protein